MERIYYVIKKCETTQAATITIHIESRYRNCLGCYRGCSCSRKNIQTFSDWPEKKSREMVLSCFISYIPRTPADICEHGLQFCVSADILFLRPKHNVAT